MKTLQTISGPVEVPETSEEIKEYVDQNLAAAEALITEYEKTETYENFTVADLRTVFDLISNPTDWKAPIVVNVKGEAIRQTVAAIKYFTATVPTVMLNTQTMIYTIASIGYRNGRAGDH